MRKKLALVIVLLIATAALLSGCGSSEFGYSEILELWRSEESSPQSADILLEAGASGGTLVAADDSMGYGKDVISLELSQGVEYSVNVPSGGRYNLSADFYILHNGYNDSEISVSINGVTEVERASLRALWENAPGEFPADKRGNQIMPNQNKVEKWQSERLFDYGRSTAMPYMFTFLSGDNTVVIELIAGDSTLIGDIRVVSAQNLVGYSEYAETVRSKSPGRGEIAIEAEKPASKNDSSIIPGFSGDINCTPYDTYKNMLNTLTNFAEPHQTVRYSFTAENEGLYKLAFNYAAPSANRTAYLKLSVDGEVPFGELLHTPFPATAPFERMYIGNADSAFEIYLAAGDHTLSVGIDCSLFGKSIEKINALNVRLSNIYLDLKKIAGAAKDANREWDPDTDFPGTTESLREINGEIGGIIGEIKYYNASDANFQAVIFLQAAQTMLNSILKEPAKIANNYAKLAESSGSVLQSLSNASYDLGDIPIDIDKIIFVPADKDFSVRTRGGWASFWEGVKKFFHSFGADYSREDGKTLDVWVFRSRQYISVMQQMIDSSGFKEETGYNVNFSLLREEGKLILTNAAGINPNAVMGVSNFIPYEMGIRGITYDLTKFEDYPEVIREFSSGALIPLIADGKGLGLPETQDFYVMFYRKDILDRYNLSLPDTWQDVIGMLPELQRYGLNFYIPLSSTTSTKSIMTTAPFIFQHGGKLFNDQGTATAIDSEESINAIKMMTEMYTLYGLPQQIYSFYESFRNGSLPIGVSTYENYLKLKLAAPEIADKWGIAPSPGIFNQSSGEVERWQTAGMTSTLMIDSGSAEDRNATWELLKWWSDAETQTEYAGRIRNLYGRGYVWVSANLEAFNNSTIFTREEKDIILGQWEWINEMPKVPGWYILERELSNAWNKIVIDGLNTRTVIEDAVMRINKEIERKMTEFGYMQDGILIHEYVVTTIEEVEKWKKK